MTEHRVCIRQPGHVPLHLVVVDRLPVGRAGDGLLIDDDRVSRHHCELRVEGGSLTVRDTGSSNGTLVNGSPLAGTAVLGSGDVVEIGGTRIEVGTPKDRPDAIGATVIGRAETITGDATSIVAPPIEQVDEGDRDQLRASVIGTTLTLVISDIVNSTVLVHQLGDREWLARLGRHDEISRVEIERLRGTVVKGQGDGFLLTFPSARHALLFSIALQQGLARERAADPTFPIHVRVGVHTGEVMHSAGDVFGRHVHRAARVSSIAGPDEIVASSLVRELAEPMGDIQFGPAESVELKGFDEPQSVNRVLWSP